ncbi:MAG: dihydrofolate reductase [Patescibacteria group bacterium]
MTHNTSVIIVAGMGRHTRAIGKGNDLLWHVPADLRRFKALTLGHPIIMGRKTFESIIAILGKPLPGRTNIIVTRDASYSYPGATTTTSLEEAFTVAAKENPSEIHIGGGAQMYEQALPYVDKIYLTLYNDDAEGDTTFPEFESDFTIATEHPIQEHAGLSFQWVDYVRK